MVLFPSEAKEEFQGDPCWIILRIIQEAELNPRSNELPDNCMEQTSWS